MSVGFWLCLFIILPFLLFQHPYLGIRHKNKRSAASFYESCTKINEELFSKIWTKQNQKFSHSKNLRLQKLTLKQPLATIKFIVLQTITHLQYWHHLIHLVSPHLQRNEETIRGLLKKKET